MSLEKVTPAGHSFGALRELQGLRVAVLAGDSADTKIDVAAIRAEDNIVSFVESAAGVLTDRTANASISDIRPTGTLTLDTVVEDETATVQGIVYTFKDAPDGSHQQVDVGGTDTISAANLAAAINAVEGGPGGLNRFFAEASGAVVTITAFAEGTSGNAYTIAGSTQITASGATLAGGSDTGGVQCSDDTTGDSILLFWFDKR